MHVYVNERYAKDLGYSTDELIGKPVAEVVALQDREMVEQRWLGRLAGKKVPSRYQFEIGEKGRNSHVEGSVGHGDRAQREPGNSCQYN